MIYISTGGFKQRTGLESAIELQKQGIDAVELSGGVADDFQLSGLKALTASMSLQVHNYFPPPVQSFVLNLASSNSDVSSKAVSHVKKAVELAVELGRPVYSFHAGFLMDPPVSQLGKKISVAPLQRREQAFALFVERVRTLAEESARLGATLLVENNVISARNFATFGTNPFLLADAEECASFMELMPSNVGLLIDVAHLKVSANSLSFDPVSMLMDCAVWTRGYHLSDNDGTADTNQAVTDSSWFWPHLRPDVDFHVLEIYNNSTAMLVEQRRLTERMLGVHRK